MPILEMWHRSTILFRGTKEEMSSCKEVFAESVDLTEWLAPALPDVIFPVR